MQFVTLHGVDDADNAPIVFECTSVAPRPDGQVQPLFTFVQAKAVLDAFNELDSDSQDIHYVPDADVFLCPDYNAMTYTAINPNDDELYPLGEHVGDTGWLWTHVDKSGMPVA